MKKIFLVIEQKLMDIRQIYKGSLGLVALPFTIESGSLRWGSLRTDLSNA